jgi:hypothetical protein
MNATLFTAFLTGFVLTNFSRSFSFPFPFFTASFPFRSLFAAAAFWPPVMALFLFGLGSAT